MSTPSLEQTTTQRKTASSKQATTRIHFENRNQDLISIDVDESGEVIECHPNHLQIWKGRFIDLETCTPGNYPDYIDLRLGRDTMNYRVMEVEQINREE